MADLLDLDYSSLKNFSLYGIDLDSETFPHAKRYAEQKRLLQHCHFYPKDAWNLDRDEEFDLVSSNGLNIYEPDEKRIVALYRQFYNSLKTGGVLVTSFLTFPPLPGVATEWKPEQVNREDALLQKIILADILEAKWQIYQTSDTVRAQLKQAGFGEIEILYDQAHIFPTVVAIK